ncbi:MAG: hypothetical protein GXP62_19555, partial [Oligoflexia bacterium]|nr:hypothetical protein [Oligoflexia bacterium]
MRRSALAVGVLIAAVGLGASPAFADDPEPTPSTVDDDTPSGPDQAGEVITIYGEEEVARRRAILTDEIRSAGYLTGKRHGDHTVYRPEVPWKPTIVIQDEGLVMLKRSPVRWMAPGKRGNLLNNLWCLPPFTPMCVRIGGQIVSTTKLDYSKGRVMERINQPGEAWRTAITNQATWDRVNDEVPRRIEATWRDGA